MKRRCKRCNPKITALTTNLDQMYMDRLNGLLSEEDFSASIKRSRWTAQFWKIG